MSPEQSRQTSIETILTNLIEAGGFTCAVVASKEGLPLATAGKKADTTMIAAVAASMKDLAERAHRGLSQIASRDDTGGHVISRYFSIDNDLLILSVQLPRCVAYRRLTDKAIRDIKQVWST